MHVDQLRYGHVLRVKEGHNGRSTVDDRRWMVVGSDPMRQVIKTIFLDTVGSYFAPIEWSYEKLADDFEFLDDD